MPFIEMNQSSMEAEHGLPTYEDLFGALPSTQADLQSGEEDGLVTYSELTVSPSVIQTSFESASENRTIERLEQTENYSFSNIEVPWYSLYITKIFLISYFFTLIELINLKYFDYSHLSNIWIIYQMFLILILIAHHLTKANKKLELPQFIAIFSIYLVLYGFSRLIYSTMIN